MSGLDELPTGRLEERMKEKAPLYSRGEAITEANRCIYCADAPCVEACPSDIDIPTFIHKISTENVRGSARTIFAENLLGASCAQVCPVEVLCAGSCVYNTWGRPPIEIGRLQRYATTTALTQDPALLSRKKRPATGKKIACIGAGPASLAAAGQLALDGHSVTLFEKRRVPGGLNVTGVAPYKLFARDALAEVEFILALGDIELKTGVEVDDAAAKRLLTDYDAVFIGIGLGPDSLLGLLGEGVVGATALIEQLKLDPTLTFDDVRTALVVGGGNTAVDIAHELVLLGVPDVRMIYRKTESVMTGYAHELVAARKDGVRLVENRGPLDVVRDGDKLAGLRTQRMDAEGEQIFPCDLVVMAVGQSRLTGLAAAFEGVQLDDKGRVVVDEATCRTGNAKVYAGGDCVNGGKEVVNAAQHGKLAAAAISASFGAHHG